LRWLRGGDAEWRRKHGDSGRGGEGLTLGATWRLRAVAVAAPSGAQHRRRAERRPVAEENDGGYCVRERDEPEK
jgi:hypothetical protein